MPYDRNSELPAEVKGKYKNRRQQSAFRKAFNNALKEYGDESKAFAVAHSAAQRISANVMNSSIFMVGEVHFEADEENPRILRFKDVILARPETNKNRDNIDAKGIQELAETIAGMPIDVDHDTKKNVGFFTAGRVGSEGELRVDGAVWLDRCEENGVDPQEVLDNLYGMSIEADAATAECSVCHKVHANSKEYCSHIISVRARMKNSADRMMRGLRALGGALTKKPAGTNTGWDTLSGITFAASHQEVDMSNKLTASEIAELWVADIVAAISKREDVSDADKKRAEKEYGDVEYADEKNKKYPLDKEHVHAAWSYINMPKNAAKYSAEELAAIKGRIKRAAKKFGMEISEDEKKNKENAAMTDEEKKAMMDKEKKETPEEEKKESPKEEKKEKKEGMEAEYEAMKASVAEMTAKLEKASQEKASMESQLQAATAQLTEVNKTLKAHRVSELRATLVGSVMADDAEFDGKVEMLLGLPQEAIDLMARKPIGADGKQRMNAAMETPPAAPKLF